MKVLRSIFFAGLVILYGGFFVVQEQRAQTRETSLAFALPTSFYTIAAGYLKQLAAEILFIKTSVFIGGIKSDSSLASHVDALGNNFEVMTNLYPRFIDPYYFCQAFLPSISAEAAGMASKVFETGIAAYPNDFILRFFYGVNFFMAMNEPLKGAEAFAEAAILPNAPQIFARLSALLSAQGGNIQAGLISLKTMLAAEKDEMVRARYREEIAIFEQAMRVQEALNAHAAKYGISLPPQSLQELVPEFLPQLPEIKDSFVLVYDPPTLRLQRPDKKIK